MDSKNDIVQAACLGGISKGVYNIEMTAAYAAIANGGVYTEPVLYTKIYDHDGNLLFEKTPKTHAALKETTAALLTNAMEGVITHGTGTAARMSNMPVAGKTGTTTDSVDLWLSAYTPYLTASVWTGYDDNKPMEGLSQSFHMKIWKKVMERIHEGYEYKDFKMPTSIEKKTICTQTGKLASSDACTAYTEYFAPGTAPTQSCPGHVVQKPAENENPSDSSEGTDNATNNSSGTTNPPSDNSNTDGNTNEEDNTDSNSNGNGDSATPPVPPTP
ncbi:MAG: penicillin-binding transpeptidase domain-containing protein [Clostridium sp.]